MWKDLDPPRPLIASWARPADQPVDRRPRADSARVNIIDVDVVKALKMDLVYNTSFLCMHIGYFCSLIAQWGTLNS